MTALNVIEVPTKFHMSINVTDIGRAVEFYRVLFGVEAAKCFDDYAKFEIDEPPTVFSLVPAPQTCRGGPLSHIGLRYTTEEQVRAVQRRLEAAGIPTRNQDDTRGCYALQTKVWVADPDQNFWEIYIVKEDLDPERVNRGLEGPAARLEPPTAPVVWEAPIPAPARIPAADASLDEARIGVGLLKEARRALRPGGKVLARDLSVDLNTLLGEVKAAGFLALEVIADAHGTTVLGRQPAAPGGATRQLLYKGPFAQVADEAGRIYPRGRRVTVPLETWQVLRQGLAAEHFVFFLPEITIGSRCAAEAGCS